MPTYTKLRGVSQVGDSLLSEQLQANLIEYYNWGMLGIGGFTNIEFANASGVYGGDLTQLHPVSREGYDDGQIWQGVRKNWVWESGVENSYQPISISGVYVDGQFMPKASGGYTINYPEGVVIFDEAVSGVVTTEYSYRYCSFYRSNVPWFREFLFSSYRADDDQFNQSGSGYRDIMFQHGIQLPCVIVEPVPRRRLRGLQLGGGRWVTTDVIFHIFAELPSDRNKLFDIITYQHQCTILGFDKNAMVEDNGYPLTIDGDLNPSGVKCYPQLIQDYFWKKIFFKDNTGEVTTKDNAPLVGATVRATFELDFPEI